MSLSLVPIYFGASPEQLDTLADRLEWAFHTPVKIRPPWFDPESAFDPSRGQYHSTLLLEQLLAEPPDQGRRVLGVTTVDLFIPIFTYVFGEAQLDGRAAVVSVHRLQPQVYGLAPNPTLTMERLFKEAVHELGHTYGLIHCKDETCVMRASIYAEEVDFKTADFCQVCSPKITE